jgi:hypothetical protein
MGLVWTKNKFKRKSRKPQRGVLEYRLMNKKLISLGREPAVLANQPRELTVPANLGQMENQ